MFNINKLKEIELVVCDIDGTLVNDKGEVGVRTAELIKELKTLGVLFSFASGRLHSALAPIAEELGLFTPLISLDGSAIRSINGKNFIYRSFLKQNHVKRAIELSENFHIDIALCHTDAIYYTKQNSAIPLLIEKFDAVYKEVESYDDYLSDTLEIVCAGDKKRTVAYVRDKFSFPFTLGISLSFFRSQSHEGIYYLELRRSGSSKGKALKRLLKYLNIQETSTAVLGDWYNDISLFQTKALKIAPRNAIQELKKRADYVLTTSNNEECVADFLEAIVKAKK